ncbi:Tyrosine-protein kinase [Parasponia andersonii]|uniref:Tyrosine-protein kinase n=1 Tax=Parasponia andersonii TaxID=3476 RepID=A0A2P5CSA7_PARAD|nr:Tyrosine-protein kinase [Parasponia andersonii]
MISPLISLKSNSVLIIIASCLLLCVFTIANEDYYYYYYKERTALYSLKTVLNDPFLNKVWTGPHCHFNTSIWYGIKCSNDGHVAELVLENMGLRGNISENALINFSELSVLSFKHNYLSGTIMDFGLNPKLTRIDLSGNSFSGQIPVSVLELSGLVSFLLQDNSLTGPVPEFNQSSLREFNVSNNILSGFVPKTMALELFGLDSYSGNPKLAYYSSVGSKNDIAPSTGSPDDKTGDGTSSSGDQSLKAILKKYLYVLDVVLLATVILLLVLYFQKVKRLKKMMKEGAELRDRETKNNMADERIKGEENSRDHHQIKSVEVESSQRLSRSNNNNSNSTNSTVGGGQAERGKLVFIHGDNEDDDDGHKREETFEMGDLLKASAEGLGQGTFGNCYKAMMEGKPVVVVKRLRNLKPLTEEEFAKQLLLVANHQRHPNLLPVLAYYNSKNEKFLVYKYVAKGNLFNRIHGGRGKRDRIPFRWGSRLSVARGVARALEFLHLNTSSPVAVPHGNLKSTNILLSENDSALVTDYGLASLIALPVAVQRTVSYRSPEYESTKRVSRKSDIWSFGGLLLELLTGKVAAYTAPAGVRGVDLYSWVHKAVREEWTAEIFDGEIAVNRRSAVPGMLRLLEIAMHCVEKSPERRPDMSEVVREVEEIQLIDQSEDEDDDHGHSHSHETSLTDDSMSTIASGDYRRRAEVETICF